MKQHLKSLLRELESLTSERNLLLALDLDGTLCPVVADPSAAAVLPQTMQVLRQLCARPQVTVCIISGRSLHEVTASLPLDAVYAGNHGLEVFGKELSFRHPDAEATQELLSEICWSFQAMLDTWPGAWLEDKFLSATIHFRHAPEQDHQTIALAVRAHMQRFERLFAVRLGRKAIDILPRVQWDKGAALRYVREQLGLENSVCLCVGDDETDETMFAAAFEEDICVRVNPDGLSIPRFRLHDSTEVLALLEEVDALAARGQQLSRAGDPNTAVIQANSRGA